MNNITLFDEPDIRANLLPFTYTRPIAEIRVGILTIREKWSKYFPEEIAYLTVPYLQKKYIFPEKSNLYINGAICPDNNLCADIRGLGDNEALMQDNKIIAVKTDDKISNYEELFKQIKKLHSVEYRSKYEMIFNIWDIFVKNARQLQQDFDLLTKDSVSAKLSDTNIVIGDGNVFIEEGAKVEAATINTMSGDVYIGREAEVMEGSLIRGPFALCEHSVLKMGAKIYGGTTIGPFSKVGGEVNNSVIFGYSNKAHDGFLGNSVIGEWCNLGADTNNSNLKNNYSEVKLWNYNENKFIGTGLQFCGLFMGDHSKCGINTMFNTGTVVGVSANIFGSNFPRKIIQSFSWGGAHGFVDFQFNKALEVAKVVYERRGKVLDDTEIEILEHIYSEKGTLS